MEKIKIAICIEDQEYAKRFVSCLMKYYQNQLEIHVFDHVSQFLEKYDHSCAVCLFSDCKNAFEQILPRCKGRIFYLEDQSEIEVTEASDGEVRYVDKYQEVNKIMEEILSHISDEVRNVREKGIIPEKTKVIAVYSLSENEYQLPYALTLGSILGEHHSVLLIDLQENSGFSRIIDQEHKSGLEDILIMAENESYSKSRVAACIGKQHEMDYIYPIENTDCLCEATGATYLNLLTMLSTEMDYEILIINLGTRFQGFTEVLNHCSEIYFMRKNGGLCQWREYEFLEELKRKGYGGILERMIKVEVPGMTYPVTSFERLVEQWKWNELGDLIRRTAPQVTAFG